MSYREHFHGSMNLHHCQTMRVASRMPENSNSITLAIDGPNGSTFELHLFGLPTAITDRLARIDAPELVNHRELSTILAALRHYQQSGFGDMHKLPPTLAAIAVDGATNCTPLDDNEIDALCEAINCRERAP